MVEVNEKVILCEDLNRSVETRKSGYKLFLIHTVIRERVTLASQLWTYVWIETFLCLIQHSNTMIFIMYTWKSYE